MDAKDKQDLEKFHIFMQAFDEENDNRLTMNEFKKAVLTKRTDLREKVILREPEKQGNFGENDFNP
jgi:hypothetical protein